MRLVTQLNLMAAATLMTSVVSGSKRLEYGEYDKLDMAIMRRTKLNADLNSSNGTKRLQSSKIKENLDDDFDILQALAQDGNEM